MKEITLSFTEPAWHKLMNRANDPAGTIRAALAEFFERVEGREVHCLTEPLSIVRIDNDPAEVKR